MSNTYQDEEPEEFSGGIIADPMGLGKTLTMISLVASDVQPRESVMNVDDAATSATTLIIVPPPCKWLVESAQRRFPIANRYSTRYLGRTAIGVSRFLRKPWESHKISNFSRGTFVLVT